MSMFTAINVSRIPNLAATDNGGDLSPPSKRVGLRAQCDEEGSASESIGEFVVVDTSRKRRGNGVRNGPARRRRLLSSEASDAMNSCPVWCRDDALLPDRVQQAHRRGRAIWAQPSHTLSGDARCGPCIRAGVDHCFVSQANKACARCTSLRNPRGQCTVESPTITAPSSGSSGVVVSRTRGNGGKGGGGTFAQRPNQRSRPRPLPATTSTLRAPRSRSSTPEKLVEAMAVLPESIAHALRVLNAHQSRRRHEYIEFCEQRRVEEMGSDPVQNQQTVFKAAICGKERI